MLDSPIFAHSRPAPFTRQQMPLSRHLKAGADPEIAGKFYKNQTSVLLKVIRSGIQTTCPVSGNGNADSGEHTRPGC
jgi:hypothetical protein